MASHQYPSQIAEATTSAQPLQNQLLATKFFMPTTPGTVIARPRLTALLQQSLDCPLTLISAPAGFGKTTLLSAWVPSLPASHPHVAWISLDEEDNDPRLFWMYVLTALDRQQPTYVASLLERLQSSQGLPLKYIVAELINVLAESPDHFLLILDDYQVITEGQVHTTLTYLIEHLPAQMHIILATRTDPPLPLLRLQARQQMLEVRANQLRCSVEEIGIFFQQVMGMHFPQKTIEHVAARTEGWLAGLQLLGLSLRKPTDSATLLREVTGDQHYILAYLTQVVLGRQPQEVQTFLLSTCMLEQLTAPLCDAVTEQSHSQDMLAHLEQANLFIVSLDNRRLWYRYHPLFAEALQYRLEQTQPSLVPLLHHRASLWYAEHDQCTQAILHALKAHEWQWAADLIEQEQLALLSLTWKITDYKIAQLWQWLRQLPADIVHARPHLCLSCSALFWTIAPPGVLEGWLDAAEATLRASLAPQPDNSPSTLSPQAWQEQENVLGEIIASRALSSSLEEERAMVPELCQQALSLLSADNYIPRTHIACAFLAYYTACGENADTILASGLQAVSLAQASGQTNLILAVMGGAAQYLIAIGRLRQAQQLTKQAMLLSKQPDDLLVPQIGWPMVWQAEIEREWNNLDQALNLATEALALCQQIESYEMALYVLMGYAVLARISLSRGDLGAARSALQEFERIGQHMSQSRYLFECSFFTTVDQVRLWLACGDLEQAALWVKSVEVAEHEGHSLLHDREVIACASVWLAKDQPALALQRLAPVLERATEAERWSDSIRIRLLQALAYRKLQQENQALDTLWEAVRLAEPEGYRRIFLDEGTSIETLLYHLRQREGKHGPTPYLDTLLAAFQQENQAHLQKEEQAKTQALPQSLSERELEVLQLLAQGTSNQEIAHKLVIAIDTVKRHVTHIFAKLGVNSRVQAMQQARTLGLLDEEG
jgi:LuxR family transcriptional regulator, maltose regulon positive regulatory protein